jgi:hypothetical protein
MQIIVAMHKSQHIDPPILHGRQLDDNWLRAYKRSVIADNGK